MKSENRTDQAHAALAEVYARMGALLWDLHQAAGDIVRKLDGAEADFVHNHLRRSSASLRLCVKAAEGMHDAGHTLFVVSDLIREFPELSFAELQDKLEARHAHTHETKELGEQRRMWGTPRSQL